MKQVLHVRSGSNCSISSVSVLWSIDKLGMSLISGYSLGVCEATKSCLGQNKETVLIESI